ncbi:MAG: S-layer homology domain-containing protein [Clostridia bacterium]|nr:S-layer homology domain-containing protein [Clostridia bacterium]
MKKRQIAALIIIVTMLMPFCALAEDTYINRGEVADMLLIAADDYNPSLVRSDIIKGYEDGLLHEERNVTRAEALVMLKRAFGTLPMPTGHNKRVSLSSGYFTDIPEWAQEELKSVFDSGIAAGTAKGIFTPDANVTKEQMELFIQRVYSLYGTNPKDDFYSSINKEELENLKILPGNATAGTLVDMQIDALTDVDKIITDLSQKENEKGTKEQKIAALYNCVTDVSGRNREGINPIRTYLEKIDSVKNITELTQTHDMISREICINTFVEFGLSVDLDDSTKYMLSFGTMGPLMNKEVYQDEKMSAAYTSYLEKILVLSGENKITAKENVSAYFEFEKMLSEKMLDVEEEQELEKIYNVTSFSKISMMFPDFDLEEVLSNCALVKADRVVVRDMALTEEFAASYNQSNLSVLKTAMKIMLIESVKDTLSENFMKAQVNLNRVILGADGVSDARQQAISVIQSVMPEYLSQIYGEMHFDDKTEQYIRNMTQDIIAVFKKRIDNLSWMDEETKNKAKIKLDAINVKVGYPKLQETYLDYVDITPPSEGGTYFNNMVTIMKESVKSYGAVQFAPVNRDAWMIDPYEVNAAYNPSSNDITIPVAILMSPIYDINASYEENLGGIGFIIAHEITHAFDAMGAKFDEKGNVVNWWKESDYEEFEKLCQRVVSFFDGVESIPAVRNNGKLTLNENIADLGAAACISNIATDKNLDLKKVYISAAKAWAETSTREYTSFLSETDPHSDEKLRINRVFVNLPEFYDAFEITENDGMYVPPEERVLIW